MMSIFLSISQSLVDSGFSQALIQKKNPTEQDYSTVFYFNIIIAILVYSIIFISAKKIALFYSEPKLELIAKIIGINLIFSSFSIVQVAKLSKTLNFKLQTTVSLISVVISGAYGIYLAYKGYGVWALVAQGLVKNGLNSILLFVFSEWKPRLIFSIKSLLSLFSYGSKLLFSGLLNAIFNNIYFVIIGKFYSVRDLGYYTRANQLQLLPSETMTVVLQRVTFPVLCTVKDDKASLEILYRRFIRMSAFVIFPVMTGLAVTASPLIDVILTSKWTEAVPFLQLLCFVGGLYPIHALNLNVLKVIGRSDLFFKLEIYKKALITFALLITLPFGLKALIYGQIVCSLISLYINTIYSKRYIDYSFYSQLIDLLPALLISLIMAALLWISLSFLESSVWKLTFSLIMGPLIYVSLALFFNVNDIKIIKSVLFTYEREK